MGAKKPERQTTMEKQQVGQTILPAQLRLM
jgi:hypothetical protein